LRRAASSSSAAGSSATTPPLIAIGLGANVTILERSIDRMRHLEEIFRRTGQPLDVVEPPDRGVRPRGRRRDRAVLIPGALARDCITREMVAEMKDGSVLADVAIDQGGCAETSRPTTHSEPVYTVEGVTHYCVANMPGAVPITSTRR